MMKNFLTKVIGKIEGIREQSALKKACHFEAKDTENVVRKFYLADTIVCRSERDAKSMLKILKRKFESLTKEEVVPVYLIMQRDKIFNRILESDLVEYVVYYSLDEKEIENVFKKHFICNK